MEGLRDDFDACERLLEEAETLAGTSEVAKVRIDLERGRKLRSSGDPAAALPLFEAAFARASDDGQDFLAGDALHMCAISVDNLDATEQWTQRGLEFGEREPAAAYWAGPLLNNLGWAYYDAGDHRRALELFEQALEVRLPRSGERGCDRLCTGSGRNRAAGARLAGASSRSARDRRPAAFPRQRRI